MIVQIWLTVLLVAALILGGVWALIYRPFLRRWSLETRREEEARRQAEQEREQREKALQEIQRDCYTPPSREEGAQQAQEIKKS
jgi:hypothetical protein